MEAFSATAKPLQEKRTLSSANMAQIFLRMRDFFPEFLKK